MTVADAVSPAPGQPMGTALEARRLVKDFRGFRATNEVNLQIREGEIHAIN